MRCKNTVVVRLLAMVVIAVSFCAGSTLSAPYVRVQFGGSGNISRPTLDPVQDDLLAQAEYQSADGAVPGYHQSASASFGTLSAFSEQTGPLGNGQSSALNSFAIMVDMLTVTSPGSLDTTYFWQPTIQLTGVADWTNVGIIDPSAPEITWPVAIAVAQYVQREGETTFTRYSEPDIYPEKGILNQKIQLTPIPVPANEAFNYRILFAAVSRIRTNADGSEWIDYSHIDLSNTLKVIGLSLRDSTGAIDFDVNAASGATYSTDGITAPVPEPVSLIPVATGLGLIAIGFLRRRTFLAR